VMSYVPPEDREGILEVAHVLHTPTTFLFLFLYLLKH
jgi:hypothetical protein